MEEARSIFQMHGHPTYVGSGPMSEPSEGRGVGGSVGGNVGGRRAEKRLARSQSTAVVSLESGSGSGGCEQEAPSEPGQGGVCWPPSGSVASHSPCSRQNFWRSSAHLKPNCIMRRPKSPLIIAGTTMPTSGCPSTVSSTPGRGGASATELGGGAGTGRSSQHWNFRETRVCSATTGLLEESSANDLDTTATPGPCTVGRGRIHCRQRKSTPRKGQTPAFFTCLLPGRSRPGRAEYRM
mmetsp:Transcript_40826/g.131330  ORF Transcript_40826/g.131330 Transcript_40826/m.131330 type:complete len:238 (+) Transcript_40826:31-744(+)